jgi:Xaa-Pro aminopeptidase
LQLELQRRDVPLVIVCRTENIQWLTGAYFNPLFEPVAAMTSEGHVTLVAPERRMPKDAAADTRIGYAAQWHSTLRNDQRKASSDTLLESLAGLAPTKRIAVEFSGFAPHLGQRLAAELLDIEPEIHRLRRFKEDDELRLMRKAIAATARMYTRAREMVEPGVNELEVYSRLYQAAVEEFGEPPTYFGQDFQCGSRGGPPRDRRARDGELFILDLGAGFRGYFSDNARTLAVNRRPTDAQARAWEQIQKVFHLVESTVKPGMSCRALFETVQALLDQCKPWLFDHHLGHGVGLYPHEAPHLNPHWDDQFETGDVFTVEPGLYHAELNCGMRIEQNYRVTSSGVERLTDFSLEL